MSDSPENLLKKAALLNKLLAMLRSDSPEGERAAALGKVDNFFKAGGDPHGFRVEPASNTSRWTAYTKLRDLADSQEEQVQILNRMIARLKVEIAKAARQNADLKSRLKKRTATDPEVEIPRTNMLADTVPELEEAEIVRRLQVLFERRDRRTANQTAEIDLPIGELVHSLDACYVRTYGKRKKRGSNGPSKAEYIQGRLGKDPSWARKCSKVYSHVRADYFSDVDWDGRGGIEGILKAVRDWKNKDTPRKPRRNRLRDSVEGLMDAVACHDGKRISEILDTLCDLAKVRPFDEEQQQQAA